MNKYEAWLRDNEVKVSTKPLADIAVGDRFCVTRDNGGAVVPGAIGTVLEISGSRAAKRIWFYCAIDGCDYRRWLADTDCVELIDE